MGKYLMIEIEYKFLISEFLFEDIIKNFKLKNPIRQVNNYFIDTDGVLRANHITVRIREYETNKLFQIKFKSNKSLETHYKKQDHLAIREEYSREIYEISEITISEIENVTGIKIKDLVNVGSMITHRYKFFIEENVIIYLDKNEYLDTCDFEVEIEIYNKQEIDINKILNKLNITEYQDKIRGKCTRFLKALSERQ